jgi:NADH-ubiquinone oxidoreductase chain 6
MSTVLILILSSLAINTFIIINPLSIGISILLIALRVAILFSYTLSSWIAFLIFLIYIRGILVIFSYFVSLTPNQTINILYLILIIALTYIILTTLSYLTNIQSQSLSSYLTQSNTFYLKSNTPILLLLALILLITIIIVVKLTINTKGPIRPFRNKYV